MKQFDEGDRVRIDIPDTTDPDYDQYHGVHGTVVEVLHDDADTVTGNLYDELIFRVEFMEKPLIFDYRIYDRR